MQINLPSGKLICIALWSCNIDQDPSLASIFSELTGAYIYASSKQIKRKQWQLSGNNLSQLEASIPFQNQGIDLWAHTLAPAPAVKFTTVHNATRGNGNFTIGSSLGSGPFTFTGSAQSDTGTGSFKLGQGNAIHGTLSYGQTSLTGYIDFHEKNIDGNTSDSEAFYFISGSSWYALITSDDGNQVSANQASLPAGKTFWYVGQTENTSADTNAMLANLNTYLVDPAGDAVAPTIAITTNDSNLTVGETATLTFTLSEASTNFTSNDITVSGGTLSNFSGSGTSYTATFTPTANSTTNGVVSVASSTFADAANNANTDGNDSDNTVTMTVNTIPGAITVTSPTVNEASPYAVFTVSGTAGQTISLSLGGGTASGSGTDYGSSTATTNLQYSLDGGTTWLNYSATGAPTLTGSSMLVRTPIVEDSLQDNGETVTLTATPNGGAAVTGSTTINDQGGGTIFNANGSVNNSATPSDDRPSATPSSSSAPSSSPTQQTSTESQAPSQESDNDGIPSQTEDRLAGQISGSNDINGDGIKDSLQPAIATLSWINNINFENAVSGNFDAVPKRSIITVQSVTQNGELNTSTALEDIKVIPFSDVPQGAPKSVFSEWTPIQFNVVPETAGGTLADVDNGRAGTQTTVLIDNSAAQLPSTYFDRYYTYVSEEIISRYREAGLELRTLDGELLTDASQAGWYDYTQRTPGGDGGRYVIKDGKIVGVEITFTDNSFGDDDPTANRITDPSTLVLEPDPKFDLKTDSQLIGDRITANGYPVVTLLGSPGKASAFALNGANGEALQAGTHFKVREITVDNVVSAYAIELLDADLNQAGNQAYGSYYTGQATRNQTNTADGTYSVLVDGDLAGTFEIRTNALDDRERIRCLNQLSGKNSLASVLYGHRVEQKRGTNGDDVITGTGGNNTIKGIKGSDLINGFGDRLEGSSLDVDADRNQRDVLTGGSGGDYFQLGDIVSSFYTGDGDKGYARVSDFKRGDRIVLTGSKDDYSKRATSINGASGLGIYQGDDLVALIQGKSAQSLVFSNADQVLFI